MKLLDLNDDKKKKIPDEIFGKSSSSATNVSLDELCDKGISFFPMECLDFANVLDNDDLDGLDILNCVLHNKSI